jgi:hypothetical protein
VKPGISVVYSTHRRQPLFEWFADALALQLEDDDEMEVILVDGLASTSRRDRFEEIVAGRFPFVHVEAKPTVFNGPYQRTSQPLFAAASARNTGIVLASYPYIVFADDCGVPMEDWWNEVRQAARHQYVAAGSYEKRSNVQVVDGVLKSSFVRPSGRDGRWGLGDDRRVVQIAGGQLYGSSMGVPREVLLDINGLDELCDGSGGEDCNLGIRLELAGHRVFYSRKMFTVESDDHSARDPLPLTRLDPLIDEHSYLNGLSSFGVSGRTIEGRCDATHMALDLVYGLRQSRSIRNHFDLRDLGPADLRLTARGLPTTYWFDNRPIEDL